MVTANEGGIEKLLAAMNIVTVVSDNRKGIASMHVHLLLLLRMHMHILLMGHVRPVTGARRGPLSRVRLVHVHLMCVVLVMRDVMLIKLLEERSAGGILGRRRRVNTSPEGRRFN